MANAKKIFVATESHEIFIVRVNGKSDVRGFCPECGMETELLTMDGAVSVSGATTLEIMKYIRESKLHNLETASGHLLICRDSLMKSTTDGLSTKQRKEEV